MGCHCDEKGEYGLKREKAEVTARKMMQYGSPLSLALESLRKLLLQVVNTK